MRTCIAVGVFTLAAAGLLRHSPVAAAGDHAALVALSGEFQAVRRPPPGAGVGRYSSSAVQQQKEQRRNSKL